MSDTFGKHCHHMIALSATCSLSSHFVDVMFSVVGALLSHLPLLNCDLVLSLRRMPFCREWLADIVKMQLIPWSMGDMTIILKVKIIFKLIVQNSSLSTRCEIALR